MTKREAYNVIKAAMVSNPEIVAFCDAEINLLDKKNEYRKTHPSKKTGETLELTDTVRNFLSNSLETWTVKALSEGIGESSPRITAALKRLTASGEVVRIPEFDKKSAGYKFVRED